MEFTTREKIVELVNKLFIYNDNKEWIKLQNEVLAPSVDIDMSSIGGETGIKSSIQICADWAEGLKYLDAINHLSGNYLVTIHTNSAEVYAYATATHYKKSALNGPTREFVGSYNLRLKIIENHWKITQFKYNLKFATGNLELT